MYKRLIRPLFVLSVISFAAAAGVPAQGSGDGIWHEVGETSALRSAENRTIVPAKYRTYQLDKTMLKTVLDSAPNEMNDGFAMSNTILSLPMPDGRFERFRIERSLVVEPALVEKFPELAYTFRGQGIDDPTATVRFDLMPNGFHSMVLSPKGTVMVDPYRGDDTSTYISYYKRDVEKPAFACGFDNENAYRSITRARKPLAYEGFIPDAAAVAAPSAVSSGSQLRTYRIALAATGEYTAVTGGGTVAGALQAQVAIMNRVNGVYERDLAMRMVIIGNNDLIVYTNAATDPYTNDNGQTMLTENNSNINTVIGSANYDIGHVFSTGGGGVASIGVVCGSSKARGVTGLTNPVGDVFAIDFVAHEIGHQWGASHTFNSTVGSCGSAGQRISGAAYEPGSGITIMGYAGICGSQNLAGNSIDTFHVKSLEEIIAFAHNGNGNTCAAVTATGNTPPTVTSPGGTVFNVPKQTPFILSASATDPNGDAVTYDWQQYDLGVSTAIVPNSDSDGNARPIFRVFAPSTSGDRTFPRNQHILNSANVPPNTSGGFMTGELLPSIARTMNFQVIARDNKANGGGVSTAAVQVVVAGTGPFQVTSPNTGTTWFLGSNPVITWNTGGSQAAPMNVANVRILLSTDGGITFPTVLSASTPNDGSEAVVSPAINTSTARIRIEPIGGIFFDVSDVNFAISSQPATSGEISGRVTNSIGRGVSKVYVRISGGNLVGSRVALTNSFGYFSFGELDFSQTYTIAPAKKGTIFTPASIVRSHNAAATDVNFTTN